MFQICGEFFLRDLTRGRFEYTHSYKSKVEAKGQKQQPVAAVNDHKPAAVFHTGAWRLDDPTKHRNSI